MKTKNPVSKLVLVAKLNFIVLFTAQAQSTTVLSSYLDIKDALVDTNPKNVSVAAGEMVSMLLVKTDDLSKKILVDAKVISESSDVKMQRKHFDLLSQNVYEYVKKSGKKKVQFISNSARWLLTTQVLFTGTTFFLSRNNIDRQALAEPVYLI